MKNLQFNILYHTQWGEYVSVVFSCDGAEHRSLQLTTTDGVHWFGVLQLPDESLHIRYAYTIIDGDGRLLRAESNAWRKFCFNHRSHIVFDDTWTDHQLSTLYQCDAFAQNMMRPTQMEYINMEQLSAPYLLILHALPIKNSPHKSWGVVGSCKALGEWNVERACRMHRTGTYEWALELPKEAVHSGFDYKYVWLDNTKPTEAVWETGDNRRVDAHPERANVHFVRMDNNPIVPKSEWRGAGIVIPVFSLRSEQSFGIGDFGDLKVFVRWAAETGMRAVQLLPINDTTTLGSWRDSYPYNSVSVFALHPIYIDPREWKNTKAFATAADEGRRLNALDDLDYEAVHSLKQHFLHDLYEEKGYAVCRSDKFRTFCRTNADWLDSYAAFCAYRDHFRTTNFRTWPRKAGTNNIASPDLTKQQMYHKFVQFLLHRQMEAAHEEARAQGVILKGDIPIGISPDSVPAWKDTRLFHFDGQAGAPPDDFARDGQNWGFPTYDWDEMAKDGYAWWKRRLSHMSHYFDAYRIDHVLGFFRIWEIPSEQIHGVLGHFRPALPLSREEIQAFGFTESVDKYAQPHISRERMEDLCRLYGNDFCRLYFDEADDGFALKEAYLSQRRIAEMVGDESVRNELMHIVGEVLFLRDRTDTEKFHPRVCGHLTRVFANLPEAQQRAFCALHENFFYVRHNEYWATEAMKKLPAVTGAHPSDDGCVHLLPAQGMGMLPCAEDLGMVPQSVKGVLEKLNILSLEIQRMPKVWGVRFADLQQNPYMSVATIATHDMPPLRLWWREDKAQTQAFWHEALHHGGDAPAEATPQVCEEVVLDHLKSPSMLCLLAFQDYIAVSPTLRSSTPEREQINVPANPNQYWRYRMHITLERLIQSTDFNEKLRGLIKMSGR